MVRRISFRAKKRLQQKIIFGILAAVLSLGLVGSSVMWTLDRNIMNNPAQSQSQPQPQLSLGDLEEKAKANPKDTGVLSELAQAYEQGGDTAKAVETYEKAVALEPGREDLSTRLAGEYVSAGQYDKAVKVLEGVIGKNPNNKDAHLFYGHALVAKNNYSGAVDEFEKYIKLAGENDPGVANVKSLLETLKPMAAKK